MSNRIFKAEVLLRLISLLLSVTVACITGFNRQTKQIFFSYEKTASIKDQPSLWVMMITVSVATGYHFLQLCRCFLIYKAGKQRSGCSKWEAWVCFILDQCLVYVVLATMAAATQSSLIAEVGVPELQWGKLCNTFTRFCNQIAAALLLTLVASVTMTLTSMISAHKLFRLYGQNLEQSYSGDRSPTYQ